MENAIKKELENSLVDRFIHNDGLRKVVLEDDIHKIAKCLAKTLKNKDSQRCYSCTHWKHRQAELEYSKYYGICTCYKWKFTTTIEADCILLDRENISKKFMGVNRFESQNKEVPIGAVEKSRYCFVTEGSFGCIHHEDTKLINN